MAEVVINILQVIQVTEHQGIDHVPVVIQYLLPFLFQISRIVQARQLVMLGNVPEAHNLLVRIRLVYHHAEHAVFLGPLPDGHGPSVAALVHKGITVLQLMDAFHTPKDILPLSIIHLTHRFPPVRPDIQKVPDGRAQFDLSCFVLVLKASHIIPSGLHGKGISGITLLQLCSHVIQGLVDPVNLHNPAFLKMDLLRLLVRYILLKLLDGLKYDPDGDIGKNHGNQNRKQIHPRHHDDRGIRKGRQFRMVAYGRHVHSPAVHVAIGLEHAAHPVIGRALIIQGNVAALFIICISGALQLRVNAVSYIVL